MLRLAGFSSALLTFVVVAAACGACSPSRADTVRSSVSKLYDRSGPAPQVPADRERLHHGALLVPPDRALLTVDVRADGDAFEKVRAAQTEGVDAVQRAVAAVEGCTSTVAHQELPSRSGNERYTASAELFVDVVLAGQKDLGARAARLEACLRALDEVALRAMKERKGLAVWPSAPLLTVDEPRRHLPALLARARERLNATYVDEAAPLAPEGWRCVPTGQVLLGARRLTGVELTLDLRCGEVPAAAPQP